MFFLFLITHILFFLPRALAFLPAQRTPNEKTCDDIHERHFVLSAFCLFIFPLKNKGTMKMKTKDS